MNIQKTGSFSLLAALLMPLITGGLVYFAPTSFCYAKTKKMTPKTPPAVTQSDVSVETTNSPITIKAQLSNEKFENTTLTKSTQFNFEGENINLNPVSHGLRKKAVFGLVPVRVYALEFLAAKPELLNKTIDGVMNSIKEMGPVQLKLTLLRDLPGTKVSDSFKEALEHNLKNKKDIAPEVTQLFKEISSIEKFNEGAVFSLIAIWKGDKGHLIIQKPDESTLKISGDRLFLEQILSIWFGKPVDAKLKDLKEQLLK